MDGEQGLQMLQENAYDVVLMDIQMPGLSGVDVTRAVRQLPDPTRQAIAATASCVCSNQVLRGATTPYPTSRNTLPQNAYRRRRALWGRPTT